MDTIFSDEILEDLKSKAEILSTSNKNLTEEYFKGTAVYVLEKIPNLINELLELRNEWTIEETENEADTMTVYESDVYITNNYHMIDPEQYARYKDQLRKEWEKDMVTLFKDYGNE